MHELDLIPAARRGAVRQAITSAFGGGTIRNVQPISGGVSGALILRFELSNRPYVLRLEPERIALHHRERGYACMSAAAAAGAAPRVHHADPGAGVALMDFVPARPLASHPGGPAGLAAALGGLVARVQAAPGFPHVGDYPDSIADLLAGLAGSPLLPSGDLEPYEEGLARVRSALAWQPESLVACHNDPNPRNLIFDGERLWLVDWELAFRNDRLVDVAILTTEFADRPQLEDILIEAALGSAPDRHVHARLRLIRLLTRLFYGCVVLDSLAGAPFANLSSQAPLTPDGFRRAVEDGRLASGSPQTAYAFARMSLRAFQDGLAAPGFADALEIARGG